MRNFLLSMVVAVGSYIGVYASNEVVNDMVISENIEASEYTSSVTIQYEVSNCRATVKFIGPNGQVSTRNFYADTSTVALCQSEISSWVNGWVDSGFTVEEQERSYNGETIPNP